jgi:glutamate racemase
MKVEGVIESAVATTVRLNPRRLGLIGGRRTVLSGVYKNAFAKHGIKVEQRIAQPLSGMIETGDTSSAKLRGECGRILSPLRNCSHILLACTHYPAIASIMKDHVSVGTTFIDPADDLVKKIVKWTLQVGRADLFFTSGDASMMKISAWRAFGVKLKKVGRVEI